MNLRDQTLSSSALTFAIIFRYLFVVTTSGGAPGGAALPQTWPWVGVDPRGFVVILQYERWMHGALHAGDFANAALGLPPDPFSCVTRALTDPDRILDNAQRRGVPPRVGNERYYRQDGYADPPHVIVVVKILQLDTYVDGYLAPAGSRLAWTFYTSPTPAVGTQLWR